MSRSSANMRLGSLARLIHLAGESLASVALAIALLGLLGWATGTRWLTSWGPGYSPMTPWSGLLVGTLAVSLLFRMAGLDGIWRRRIARWLAAVVGLVALVFLVHLPRYAEPLPIDLWWFPDAVRAFSPGPVPGRPSPQMAVFAFLVALLILFEPRPGKRSRLAWPLLVLVTSTIPLISVSTFLLGTPVLSQNVSPASATLPAAVAMTALMLAVLALLLANPSLGWFLLGPYRWSLVRAAVTVGGMPLVLAAVRAILLAIGLTSEQALVAGVVPSTLLLAVGAVLIGARSQQRHFLADYAADASFVVRTSGEIEWVSPSVENLAGWRPSDLVGRRAREFTHPDDLKALWAGRDALLAGRTAQYEARLRQADGTYRWVSTFARPVLDGRGRPLGGAGGWRDIQAEVEAREATARLAAERDRLIARLPVGVLRVRGTLTNGTHAVEFASGRARDLLGLPQEPAAVDREFMARAVHVEDLAAFQARMRTAIVQGGDFVWEGRSGGQGAATWLRIEGSVDRGEAGVYLFDGIVQDVSRAKAYEAELLRARAEAEQTALAEAEFLANMAHEIRTPLTAVMGLLKLLGGSPLDDAQRSYTERAERAAQALLAILNDVLDYSKIEARSLELETRPLLLDDVLDDVGLIMAASVGDKRVDLHFDIDPDIPQALVADELRLRQVLVNLSSNAVKFTDQGEILVAARLVGRDSDSVLVEFSVRDTGIGMSDAVLSRVFEGFVQGESGTARQFGGTGLGLTISRQLIELMGGELSVVSSPGEGSTFSFRVRLPLAEDPQPTRPRPSDPPRVLVVSDSATAREVVVRVCAGLGWSASAASHADACPSGLDLVLVDCVGDTCTAPALADDDGRPVLVALTTQAGPADHAGQDEFDVRLLKPFTASALLQAVSRARAGAVRSRALRRAPGRPLAGLHLLLAEDDETNREVMRDLLTGRGALVTPASDGQEAVAAVRANPDGFDAVLMDMNMPVMDGLAATRAIRVTHPSGRLAILGMTANALDADRRACLEAGMDDHVSKPFDLDELVRVILRWTSSRPRPPAVLNTEAATARLGGDTSFYSRMLAKFAARLPESLADVHTTLPGGDAAALREAAHSLKGAAMTLGAEELADAALALEAAGHEGRIPGSDDPLVLALEASARRAREEITRFLAHAAVAPDGSAAATASPGTTSSADATSSAR